jgi:hypothetical protein
MKVYETDLLPRTVGRRMSIGKKLQTLNVGGKQIF